MIIDIQIDPRFAGKVNEDRLRCLIAQALELEGRSEGELTILITSDEQIQELNKRYRSVDAPTDVLSFGAMGNEGAFVTSPEASAYLGDIVVSYPRAAEQAQEYGHSVEEEIDLLAVHGFLHLLGYDHETEVERRAMWARQEHILKMRGEAHFTER